ncbi:MAG TPA: A/G-specific adenine glycosylase [Propionibacteriaceae bacterium]|nr:A/G-specific adenine glycosylase [Propionibacteriaceae bacterium]
MEERAAEIVRRVVDWYALNARDLPWRRPEATPWGILVSEVMLQQTPVSRVLEPWSSWVRRWPTPASLAAEPSGAAVASWGRLGYPRRALRLHAAAVAITERHGGTVPRTYEELRALPGIGDYTAAAVASFAYGARHAVVDTNVRRVLARVEDGKADEPPSAASRRLAASYVPDEDLAPRWAVAAMELGAVVCTARSPRCDACPVSDLCAWRAAGQPVLPEPVRRSQPWHGTDRQCRGALLHVLREAGRPVARASLVDGWTDREQAARCLEALCREGLVHGTDPVSLYGPADAPGRILGTEHGSPETPG